MKASSVFFQSDRLDETEAICTDWIKKATEMKIYYSKWVEIFEKFSNDLVICSKAGHFFRWHHKNP